MNRLPPLPTPPAPTGGFVACPLDGLVHPLLVAQAVAVYRLAADLTRAQLAPPRRAPAFSRN